MSPISYVCPPPWIRKHWRIQGARGHAPHQRPEFNINYGKVRKEVHHPNVCCLRTSPLKKIRDGSTSAAEQDVFNPFNMRELHWLPIWCQAYRKRIFIKSRQIKSCAGLPQPSCLYTFSIYRTVLTYFAYQLPLVARPLKKQVTPFSLLPNPKGFACQSVPMFTKRYFNPSFKVTDN